MQEFGIIIACCEHDYHYVQGCCASIRHFLGDVPICLIVDGNFSVQSLEKTYQVSVINRDTISHQVLKQRSFGWGLTKMIAFWESPWENFLYLDSDTNVWGNILKYANFQNFDLIIDLPRYEHTDAAINQYFFNIQLIETHFPNFNWRAHRGDFFCTGTYFAKRDIFSLDEYIQMLDLMAKDPSLFPFGGEMGFLNLMMFKAADEGKIRLQQVPMQLLVPDFEREELKQRFPVTQTGVFCQDDEAKIIHWCGAKPASFTSQVYAEPMNFARRKFLRDASNCTGLKAEVALKAEDLKRYFYKYRNKVRRQVQKMLAAS